MNYDRNNIFARIIRGEVACRKIYEDDFALAFYDAAPVAPVHALVVPKGEFISFADFSQNADAAEITGFFSAVHNVAKQLGVVESGYRLITNHGKDAAQTVLHFHVHIIAGKNLGGLLPDVV